MQNNDLILERIKAFEAVRDIPYKLGIDGSEDSSCSVKAILLQRRLATLGLGSKPVLVWFRWSQLGLPEDILKLAKDDLCLHQFLSVHIPESDSWVDVDPTWDIKLSPSFSVSSWNGEDSSSPGVPILERLSINETANVIANGYTSKAISDYIAGHYEFMHGFNNYLEECRSNYSSKTPNS